MCTFGAQGYSKTFVAFIDKIEFFITVCEIICSKKPSSKEEVKGKNLLSKEEIKRAQHGTTRKSFIEKNHQA